MNKRYSFLFSTILSIIGLGLLLVSCSEDSDCSMTARPYMVCKTYKYGAVQDIVLPDTLAYLTVKALETDSILYNKGQNISSLDIPLRYTKDETAIVLEYSDDPDDIDIIRIAHESTPFFISIECGYQIRQEIKEITSYTKNRLDKVILRNKEANSYGKENVQLIFRN